MNAPSAAQSVAQSAAQPDSSVEGIDAFLDRVGHAYPWIFGRILRHDRAEVPRAVVESFDSGQAENLPPPPFAAARNMQPLREAGPLLFSLALTNEPWRLEADAIVVPVGPRGELGTLGLDMNRSGSMSQDLKELAHDASETEGFGERVAVLMDIGTPNATPGTHSVIFATEGGTRDMSPSVDRAVRACLTAIEVATRIDASRALVLPLVRTGASFLEPGQALRRLLADFDPRVPLGTLAHVIVVTPDDGVFDELALIGASDLLVLARQLENDLPRGEGKLNVQSDIDALADAMAMRDMQPPLVVGILGGWGTGKSFALHLLKELLRKIRCWDLTKPRVHESFPFVGHIYLVHFDAWT